MDFSYLNVTLFKWLMLIVFSTFSLFISAQTSTFDTNNEGWKGIGDPTNTNAAWQPTGGNPGGYAKLTDAATGGTWYFKTPDKYTGNKCGAYGKHLHWDQFTSDTTDQSDYAIRPDVIIYCGGGVQLCFNNPLLPTLDWIHYDILMKEDAGWHLTSNAGPVPTQAEFLDALSQVNGIQIRGEYRSQVEFGGIDNFVLEGEVRLDLDEDDSSLARKSDFLTDSLCEGMVQLADVDLVLISEEKIDSITIFITNHQDLDEKIAFGNIPNSILLQQFPYKITLINNGNAAPADFIQVLSNLKYSNNSIIKTRGQRNIQILTWNRCGESASAFAYVPFYPLGNAGDDVDLLLCEGADKVDLGLLFAQNVAIDGVLVPTLHSGDLFFDPKIDSTGTYKYIVYSAKDCPNDTALFTLKIVKAPDLGLDTTICKDKTILLEIKNAADFQNFNWSDGSRSPKLIISEKGIYTVTVSNDFCTFSDSIRIETYNCNPCLVYVPNVFSPNGDGNNDEFTVGMGCEAINYQIQIYDRWGNLVFKSNNIAKPWNGEVRGKTASMGVYSWFLEVETELFGKSVLEMKCGDLSVFR
jgi:gliding motility-associated-like protein